MLVKDLKKELREVKALLSKAASTPNSQVSNPNLLFGGFGPAGGIQKANHGQWPVERLERLAKAYDHEQAVQMLAGDGQGRARGIGWGPALVKMANIALKQSKNYGMENLQTEYGFNPIDAAGFAYIKGLGGEVRKTALADSAGMTGGYTIPPQFMNELLTIAAEDEFFQKRAKVLPMVSRTADWPMLDITTAQASGVTPYYGGIVASWQPEAATINETEPQFRQSTWTAWDLVLYTLSSNQLLADNGIGLDALLTQLFAGAMVWYKEYAFINGLGAGASMPLGILKAPATIAINRTAPQSFKLADASNMLSRLHIRSWKSSCWLMNQSVLPQLIQMVDNGTSNRLVWLNPMMPGDSGPAANSLPMTFFGLPIIFTEKVPQLGIRGDVCLVDLSRYVIGNRLDYQIDVSPHYRFQNNQLAWRVVARCDGRPWLNSFIQDASGWQSSPFIVLN